MGKNYRTTPILPFNKNQNDEVSSSLISVYIARDLTVFINSVSE